jgi:truncated hemoglobin YjbI
MPAHSMPKQPTKAHSDKWAEVRSRLRELDRLTREFYRCVACDPEFFESFMAWLERQQEVAARVAELKALLAEIHSGKSP